MAWYGTNVCLIFGVVAMFWFRWRVAHSLWGHEMGRAWSIGIDQPRFPRKRWFEGACKLAAHLIGNLIFPLNKTWRSRHSARQGQEANL